ncbi:hypothetical protein L6R46_17040 [Myxococcota bacterium]|jgi:hypothetical protein|nr:hypothetical protein [Myxococcota bacterium]
MNHDLQAQLRAVSPQAVREHLLSQGWVLTQDLSERFGVLIFSRGDLTLDLPLDPDLADYPRRMLELLEPLAASESVSVPQLLIELSGPAGDVLSVRVISEATAGGTLPLLDALRVREGVKNLVLAAAHSALSPQPFFPRMTRAEAVQLLNSVHEGQTQRGSFIARFIVPVEPEVQLTLPGNLEPTPPFARRVTSRLMQTLEGVRRVRARGEYGPLLQMSGEGVSANLLTALEGMSLTSGPGALELSMRWSRNRVAPSGVSGAVTLGHDALTGLGAVANELKGQATAQNFDVTGYVSHLTRQGEDPTVAGDAVIVPIGGELGELSRIHVHLPPDAYGVALEAHKHGRVVRAVGTLVRNGRRWSLSGVSSIELPPDPAEL